MYSVFAPAGRFRKGQAEDTVHVSLVDHARTRTKCTTRSGLLRPRLRHCGRDAPRVPEPVRPYGTSTEL